jgi:hypothetical protein
MYTTTTSRNHDFPGSDESLEQKPALLSYGIGMLQAVSKHELQILLGDEMDASLYKNTIPWCEHDSHNGITPDQTMPSVNPMSYRASKPY